MTIEEKVKELILRRYNSVREFSIYIDMPNSTLESIFKRGIGNSSVTNVIKICKGLGISADALAEGKIVSVQEKPLTQSITGIDVEDLPEHLKNFLNRYEKMGAVRMSGKLINPSEIDTIVRLIHYGVEIAKTEQKANNKNHNKNYNKNA